MAEPAVRLAGAAAGPPRGGSPAGGDAGAPLLELRDLWVRRGGEALLERVSLTVARGALHVLVGPNGAGKSTLLAAILGQIAFAGRIVAHWRGDGRIGLVPQKPYLFTGTVASNLRYGNPQATDEELWDALEVAQAKDFVEAMPGGLEAPIAQGGTNVSGGQRQRLSIARALVRQPEIYLFDDSFSALDLATDARLRAALHPRTADAAVVIVSQRVSTIADADQIVVLDSGTVVGLGRHDDLIDTCPTYLEIVQSQLAAEPAA